MALNYLKCVNESLIKSRFLIIPAHRCVVYIYIILVRSSRCREPSLQVGGDGVVLKGKFSRVAVLGDKPVSTEGGPHTTWTGDPHTTWTAVGLDKHLLLLETTESGDSR
jgi:hypothetical protein